MDDGENGSESENGRMENPEDATSEDDSEVKNGVQNGVQNGQDDSGEEDSASSDGEAVVFEDGSDEGEEMTTKMTNGGEADSESSEAEEVAEEEAEEVSSMSEDEEKESKPSRSSRPKRERKEVAEEEADEVSSMSDDEEKESKPSRSSRPKRERSPPKKRGRPPKNGASPKSPPKGRGTGRGRPKKLKAKDIMEQLDDDDEDDEDEDGSEEESSSPRYKKRKVEVRSSREEDESKRRSGRERKVPKKFEVEVHKKKKKKKKVETESSGNEDSDSDYESRKKKKAKKKIDKFNIYKKSPTKMKRKKKEVKLKMEDSEDDISDGEVAKQYKSQKKNWKDLGEKKSNRLVVKKKYQDEATSHSSDVASDFDPKAVVVVEEDIEGIDYVLDHRDGRVGATGENTMVWSVKNEGDPNETLGSEEREEQFLIKWSGWSHLNNTWESEDSLKAKRKGEREVKGYRKLANYQLKLGEFKAWKRRASPEDVEYQEIDIEMGRQLLTSYVQIDRIFAQRKNEVGGTDYYVKWRNLPYSEATWEDMSVLSNYYSEDLAAYTARKRAKANPRNYAEAMKAVKKKFNPMKEQPSYLGSKELRLRDYQVRT